MRRELAISEQKIDEQALSRSRAASAGMGAAVYFVGIVRGTEEGRPISGLAYEAFEKMARYQFELLFDQAQTRWPLESVRLVHRVGFVAAGEASLWIEVVAPHREEAFAACQFIVREMKRVVPIWKKAFPLA
ncbi:MAG TPA: molybdenum cofactor biosynthesis protein MoaE [Verrucomicrobiae bacterium]|jgi:molybdopterin synthase catalytic subunit